MVEEKLDRIVLRVGGEDFATYVIRGCRRPYFWPVLGPSGASVVRGQGSPDHPHHTGLALELWGSQRGWVGEHLVGLGRAPVWSRRAYVAPRSSEVSGRAVFGELVHDLVYVDSSGEPIATEVRSVRWWWASRSLRFLDFDFAVTSVVDKGPCPFILTVRAPTSFAIPQVGLVSNSAGARVPDVMYDKPDYYRAGWVDMSGPTAGPPPEPRSWPPRTSST